jgi:hypothetical protein
MNINILGKKNKRLLVTIITVTLIAICSVIGLTYEKLYLRETTDWLAQALGQDISNLFFVSPILLISAYFSTKGNNIAKIIWIGTMLTNIYSYVIYCFATHFNFLFHVYCIILGLSIYLVIDFFIKSLNVDFKTWFNENTSTKPIGIFLFIIACIFLFLWLSDSLPAALNNTVPENITKDALLTNPVQALDFSFYIPLMIISSYKILKKKTEGYLLAPMMMVFAILTNINIISLMCVSMKKLGTNNMPPIIIFTILEIICLTILLRYFRDMSKTS